MSLSQWVVLTGGPEETRELGVCLGKLLDRPGIVLLKGDLGTGKTCFVQGLARGVGVPSDEPVTSPSYSLMNHLSGRFDLFHFDLYRLSRVEELEDLGLEEFFDGSGVAVVEWADRLAREEPESLTIAFQRRGPEQRILTFLSRGDYYRILLQKLAQEWPAGAFQP